MDDILQRWAASLTAHSRTISRRIAVTGTVDRCTGASIRRASATAVLEPADRLIIVDEVVSTPELWGVQFPVSFIFGLLDVLAKQDWPVLKVKVTLTNAVYDPIHSSVLAFRLAGHDAGRKVMAALDAP